MIPNAIQPEAPKIEETDHPVQIRWENFTPIPGATRWYSDRNTVWITRTMKTTIFRGEECVETRRDVYNSAMRHICYSLFYEQVTPGGRYLLGDVQTSAPVPTIPVVCYHKPRELVHPLPLKEGLTWKDYTPRSNPTTPRGQRMRPGSRPSRRQGAPTRSRRPETSTIACGY